MSCFVDFRLNQIRKNIPPESYKVTFEIMLFMNYGNMLMIVLRHNEKRGSILY